MLYLLGSHANDTRKKPFTSLTHFLVAYAYVLSYITTRRTEPSKQERRARRFAALDLKVKVKFIPIRDPRSGPKFRKENSFRFEVVQRRETSVPTRARKNVFPCVSY